MRDDRQFTRGRKSRIVKHDRISSAQGIAPRAIDALTARCAADFGFLRERWFRAGPDTPVSFAGQHRSDGALLAALPLRRRSIFGFPVGEVAGGYWPFRSVPLEPDARCSQLRALFEDSLDYSVLRIGPCVAGDPSIGSLAAAAREAGWSLLEASLGTIYEMDLPDPAAEPQWPSAKTQRKNRWRERRLSGSGEVQVVPFTGRDWTSATRDALAAIERASWLGQLQGGGDTKFANPAQRAFWENCSRDEILADMLRGSVMWIGEKPAAFAFGIRAGDTLYCIANNYDARFRKFGPGRLLLYREFERARQNGARLVSWGSGDAGYKTEMGARPGPELRDLLFVRNRLLAWVLDPIWKRRGSKD